MVVLDPALEPGFDIFVEANLVEFLNEWVIFVGVFVIFLGESGQIPLDLVESENVLQIIMKSIKRYFVCFMHWTEVVCILCRTVIRMIKILEAKFLTIETRVVDNLPSQ